MRRAVAWIEFADNVATPLDPLGRMGHDELPLAGHSSNSGRCEHEHAHPRVLSVTGAERY
eukprot:CAMPEP_0115855700 /NCGR_PEP_ID=MMETSP0287-20121206/14676_1 /TAXON_ID=412157 /ORGANISM="Chrysochromulina rotalis, Strain UIO044" /LENGTH=59 /DNA_ID=CAMNT_0003309859 /DNA_START=544 /DNA_END=720 /DNA_ORIENTATION=+